jgi:hypothetical protein
MRDYNKIASDIVVMLREAEVEITKLNKGNQEAFMPFAMKLLAMEICHKYPKLTKQELSSVMVEAFSEFLNIPKITAYENIAEDLNNFLAGFQSDKIQITIH